MFKQQVLFNFIKGLSPREKKIFYTALFMLLVLSIDRLAISPITNRLDALNKEIHQKQSAINRYLLILAQKERIKQQVNKLNVFLESLKASTDETTSLLKEIERIANKSAVYLVDMKPAGLRQEVTFKKYLINLSCEAQMPQLVEFMYNIESSHRLLTIEKYQITPKSKEGGVASCTMTVAKIAAM